MAENIDNGNGKVTMAILGEKLDNIKEMLARTCERQDEDRTRLGIVERDITRIDGEINRVQDRQSALAVAQGILSAVLSAIAGWFGSRP